MVERADASTEQLVDRDWFSVVAPGAHPIPESPRSPTQLHPSRQNFGPKRNLTTTDARSEGSADPLRDTASPDPRRISHTTRHLKSSPPPYPAQVLAECVEPAILDAARTAHAREADADEDSDEDDAAHSPWVRRMRQILRTADLDNTTVNAIREQLQEEMGQRVPKKDLREAVESFLSERVRKHGPGRHGSRNTAVAWHRQRSHGDAWRCFLDEQKAAGIARGAPCTAVWMAGAVAYRCRTCQTGEQSSVCVRCFRASDHEGHDYIMYRSETGGVCDCGDLESWSAQGCCDAHRPITHSRANNSEDSSKMRNNNTFPEGIAPTLSGGDARRGARADVARARVECSSAGPHLPPAAGARREAEGKMAEKLLKWFCASRTAARCARRARRR